MINHWWLQYLDINLFPVISTKHSARFVKEYWHHRNGGKRAWNSLKQHEIISLSEKTITFVVVSHVKKYHKQLPRIMHVQSLHHQLLPLILEWILIIDQGTSCTEISKVYRINCTLEKDQRSVELYILIWIYCLLACL